jgi:beta-galactosidase/beta-glucuronidase
MFWDNHDLPRVKTHGLVFETRVEQGRLLVSTLNHSRTTNSAGRWLLSGLLRHLDQGAAPKHALTSKTLKRMREKIDEDKIELVQRPWRFKPDPDNHGLMQQWHSQDFEEDETWKEIRIGTAWEGLGYPALDGWAWYRIAVDVPESWSDKPVYVSFEGVDDYYELYVNGQLAGSGGDIETKTTAFEDRTSHLVTDRVQPGQTATIAVRVYDWYGAGGLFRPVSVGTAALGNGETEVLK